MNGEDALLLNDFIDGKKRFVIPVYQRKYDWKADNCRTLFNDLIKVVDNDQTYHFFGSIVSQPRVSGPKTEFQIIDGQQRLTTISLLLLAISDLLRQEIIESENEDLAVDIIDDYITTKWDNKRVPKLCPVKEDRIAYEKLIAGDEEEFDAESNLTNNYILFKELIQNGNVNADKLFDGICRLQVILCTLDKDDDPQVIFESLNSTGLALTEGDKIRNYILMGLSPQDQDKYYEKYWVKIEACTGREKDVSGFVRDYLSIKQLSTPTISNVYPTFKNYVETERIPLDSLLSEMLIYARLYQKLQIGCSGLNSKKLDDCMYRLKRLEITVTEPFFMEVLRLNQDGGKISVSDLERIFLITENYLFRRNICDVPTNALNKIFLNLNREVIRFDNNTDDYVNKFIYALLSKKESGRFPEDEEFSKALSEKAVYLMRGKYKAYLFERFENYGILETKDVYMLLDNGTYTIEHIMPQHLSPEWIRELGPNAERIHDTWLHRLGNLTLTAYNSNMGNEPFQEKRDAELGYRHSGLRMNQIIATKDKWGEEEIEERSERMVAKATSEIWAMPFTTFVPAKKEFDSCTLDDESYNLKGREIIKYSYKNSETPVTSWVEMFERIIKYLHSEDRSVLTSLALDMDDESDLGRYFSADPKALRTPLKIDEKIYAEKNTSTELKMTILRRLFNLYHADPMDLVFYLRDSDSERDTSALADYKAIRIKYWTYALPIVQKAHRNDDGTGCFSNCHPGTSYYMSGFFGIGGFQIDCAVSTEGTRVDLYLGKNSKDENKRAFDYLYAHKQDVEQKLKISPVWNRANDNKASWVSYGLSGVSVNHETDWEKMARFQAEWSKKFYEVFVPLLKECCSKV